MASEPTSDAPLALNENDLRPHGHVVVYLHGDEAVWVGDIAGPADTPDPLIKLGIKHLDLVGHASVLLDRLRAAVDLLEQVTSRRGDWDQLLTRQPRGTRRTWPHPFVNDPAAAAESANRSG